MKCLIDYAGLFPPSELPFEEAFTNYKKYFLSSDSWILNRFICPVSKLDNLPSHFPDFTSAKPLPLSVLITGNFEDDDYLKKFNDEINTIKAFENKYGEVCQIQSLEAKIEVQNDSLKDILSLLSSSIEPLDNSVDIFLEPKARNFPSISNQISVLAIQNIHLKLRCGGIVPEAFLSSEKIASALVNCKNSGIKLKFTAGLHHPISHFNEQMGTKMHGFVNVFGAALLFYIDSINQKDLIQILDDENSDNFRFENSSFFWKNASLSAKAIGVLREEALLSYGSCSFDEPRDGLRSLGWM